MAKIDPAEHPPLTPPPIDALLTEVIASLALAAHAYLTEGSSGDEGGAGGEDKGGGGKLDLESAEIAIDVAAAAFERVKERLEPQHRLGIAGMLTDVRMAFVRKRG